MQKWSVDESLVDQEVSSWLTGIFPPLHGCKLDFEPLLRQNAKFENITLTITTDIFHNVWK